MRKLFATALIMALPFTANADEMQNNIQTSKQVIKGFFTELKGELGKAMKSGGPLNAINVCNKLAPAIAKKHGDKSGMHVARTSLKLRNPDNAPDAWERKVLEQFEARRAKGENPAKMAFAEVVEENGKKTFRFMKAIGMPPVDKMPCLKCHGENINPKVAAKLDELYPKDQARGYKAGQIRGAFTLSKPL